MSFQFKSLLVFCIVLWINTTGLAVDVLLISNQIPTISEYCARHWWAGALVVLINCVPPVVIAFHFWGPWPWPNRKF